VCNQQEITGQANSFFVFTKSISKTLFKFVTANVSEAESISPAGGGKGVEKTIFLDLAQSRANREWVSLVVESKEKLFSSKGNHRAKDLPNRTAF
jgi:hypothetical protein